MRIYPGTAAVAVLLLIMISSLGCSSVPHRTSIIQEEVVRADITVDWGERKVVTITVLSALRDIVNEINKGKRTDISDLVWEIGPDGLLVLWYEDGHSEELRFFSDYDPVSLLVNLDGRLYQIHTKLVWHNYISQQ